MNNTRLTAADLAELNAGPWPSKITAEDAQEAWRIVNGWQLNTPCPICRERDGFHDEQVHRDAVIVPWELIKQKGWQK